MRRLTWAKSSLCSPLRLLLGLAAVICDSRAVYNLTVVACGLALVGYAATRLITFPQLGDDVGNWFEPLGVVSVLAETAAVIIAIQGWCSARPAGLDARTCASGVPPPTCTLGSRPSGSAPGCDPSPPVDAPGPGVATRRGGRVG